MDRLTFLKEYLVFIIDLILRKRRPFSMIFADDLYILNYVVDTIYLISIRIVTPLYLRPFREYFFFLHLLLVVNL